MFVRTETDLRLTDEASWRSVLQVIVFRKQGNNLGENGFAHQLSFLVLGDDTWSHLNLLAHLKTQKRGAFNWGGTKHYSRGGDKTLQQSAVRARAEPDLEDALQDTSSRHATFQVIDFTSGFVHVKRSDNCKEVPVRQSLTSKNRDRLWKCEGDLKGYQ